MMSRISRRSAVVAAGVALAVAVGMTGRGPALASSARPAPSVRSAALTASPWRVPGLPARPAIEVGGSSELDGVFCLTGASCWAVGFYGHDSAELALTVHWNGKKWSRVPAPSPGGTGHDAETQLSGVRCTSSANCWAVGTDNKHGAVLSLALHWNGKKWFRVATPEPGGTLKNDLNELYDVACVTADDCWADLVFRLRFRIR